MYKVFLFIMLFLIYSFLGWFMETIYSWIVDKKFVNRGFLIGPSCPIYGVGCMLILIFLGRYKDEPITLFCMAVVVCSILEYFTSYIMEKIFKTRWWDYSQKKFNLNGRVCLDNLVAFGVLGLLIVKFVNPFVLDILHMIDPVLLKVITSILLVVFVLDVLASTKIIYNIKGLERSELKDQTEEITAKVKEVLLSGGVFTRRIVNAFPNFKIRSKEK